MPLSVPPTIGGCRRIGCRRVGGLRRVVSVSARAAIPETASDGDKPAQKETSVALAIAADPDVSDDNSIDLSTYRSSVDQVKAIAAKISTARRLARKLAEEKAAVSAISDGDSREAELIRRKTQLNSAEAAASAARADALARSSKLKITSTRSREAARLAAENKALLEVLTTVADGNPSIQAKLQAIRRKYPVGSKKKPSAASVNASLAVDAALAGTGDKFPKAAPSAAPAETPAEFVKPPSTDAKHTADQPTNGAVAAAAAPEATPDAPVDTPKSPEAAPEKAPAPQVTKSPVSTASLLSSTPTPVTPSDAPKEAAPSKPAAPTPVPAKSEVKEITETPAVAKTGESGSQPKKENKVTAAKPAATQPPVADKPPTAKAADKKVEKPAEPAKEKLKEQKVPSIVANPFKSVFGGLGALGVSGDKRAKEKQQLATARATATAQGKAAAEAAKEAEAVKQAAQKQQAVEKQKKVEAEEAAMRKIDADAAKAKADADAKVKADADAAKVKADAAVKAKADADAKVKSDAAAKLKAEEEKEAKLKAEEKQEAKRKVDAAASRLKADATAKQLVQDKTAAAFAAKAAAEAKAAGAKTAQPQQPPATSAASSAATAAAEAAAEATAAVPKAAAAAAAAAAKAAEAPPATPPFVSKEDSQDPSVTSKQPAGTPNLPGKDSKPVAKVPTVPAPLKDQAKLAQQPPAQKSPLPAVTAQSSTQDIVSALEATKARLSGKKSIDTRKPMSDFLPDPEAVEKLKAKAAQAAEASYKAKSPPGASPRTEKAAASKPPPTTPLPPSTASAIAAQQAASAIAAQQAASAIAAQQAASARPTSTPPAKPAEPPKEVVPTVGSIVSDMKRKGFTVTTDLPARPGTSVRIFVDKSKTAFAFDDNEHQLQLKMGLNNWTEIHVYDLKKISEIPNVNDVYTGMVPLPRDLFAVDFVIQDFRTTKVDNNEGLDYKLKLVDAPTEDEIENRRAREFEAAEHDRLLQIAEAEAEISKEVGAEREDAEGDAMHDWWRVRRADLRQHAINMVQQELGGSGEGCADSLDGVYEWLSGRPTPGKQAELMYNRDASELRHKKDLVLHLGCNNWAGQKKELYKFTKALQADLETAGIRGKEGNWYSSKVMIPSNARIIDFVVSDKDLQVWDNNHHRDYHSRVSSGKDQATLEEEAYRQLLSNSLDSDTEAAQRAAKKAGERVLLRADAQRKRRSSQRKVLYTNPLVPKAGETCEVYYNPDMTVLSGRPEVYMRGSWNRWTHSHGIPTTKMEPAFTCGIGFMKAAVKVPEDAIVADFVFLDSGNEQSGFYDNNNGLDYHVPVIGSKGTLPPLRVAHVSVEMAPIAKVGGMGDVVTALGRAVQEYGHEVEVLMPKYDCLRYDLIHNIVDGANFNYSGSNVRVFRGQVEGLNTTFLEPDNGMFGVGCVYGRDDDAHRFNYFCGAALEYLKHHAPHKTDVVHCHDWPTAPVAFGDVGDSKTVFTIHNLNYGADLIGRAMDAASVATTVSPTYAQEISGHPAVAANLGKMFGVRNGIDVDIWDPSTDKFLPVNYSIENFEEGKAAAKRSLRQRMNLSDTDVPIVGVVTRLTHQKGIHLIKHAAFRTLERGGQFVLLGSAPDPRVQQDFEQLAGDLQNQYNDRARLVFSFDEPLSHMIYAGCDLILVPSMFEPCGLTQMIGMRYGTIAVVRKTGGLADTVFDVDDDEDRAEAYGMEVNGFNFEGTDNGGLDYALNRSMNMWYGDRAYFTEIAKRCMALDWSWYGPAQDYVELYYRALKNM